MRTIKEHGISNFFEGKQCFLNSLVRIVVFVDVGCHDSDYLGALAEKKIATG